MEVNVYVEKLSANPTGEINNSATFSTRRLPKSRARARKAQLFRATHKTAKSRSVTARPRGRGGL